MDLRKLFLYLLIGSVAICAVMGIVVLLFGTFGEFESKVLGTTFTITVTSILGLACGAYYEAKGAKGMPYTGIALSVIAAVLVIIVIWAHTMTGDIYAKSTVTASMLATTFGLLCLVSLATLDQRFAWSRTVIIIAAVALDAILLYLIWVNPDNESDFIARSIGLLSIIIASLVVVTPVFHKLSHTEPALYQLDAEIESLRSRLAELEAKRSKLDASDVIDSEMEM